MVDLARSAQVVRESLVEEAVQGDAVRLHAGAKTEASILVKRILHVHGAEVRIVSAGRPGDELGGHAVASGLGGSGEHRAQSHEPGMGAQVQRQDVGQGGRDGRAQLVGFGHVTRRRTVLDVPGEQAPDQEGAPFTGTARRRGEPAGHGGGQALPRGALFAGGIGVEIPEAAGEVGFQVRA